MVVIGTRLNKWSRNKLTRRFFVVLVKPNTLLTQFTAIQTVVQRLTNFFLASGPEGVLSAMNHQERKS